MIQLYEKLDFIELLQLHNNCTGIEGNIEQLKKNIKAAIGFSIASSSHPISLYEDKILCGFLVLHIDRCYGFLGNETAYFSSLYCVNSITILSKLIEYTESIASQQGCNKIVGPVHDSILIDRGIPDFKEKDIPFGMPKIQPYLLRLLMMNGFSIEQNLIELLCTRESNIFRRDKLTYFFMKHFTNIKYIVLKCGEIKSYSNEIKDLFNDAWKNNWGFRKVTLREVEVACTIYESQNNTAMIAVKENKLIGIAMAAQDMDLSIGEDTFWRAYLIGVLDNYKKKGLALALFTKLSNYLIHDLSARYFSCSWMLESNNNVISLIRKVMFSRNNIERKYSIMSKELWDDKRC